jgi:MFS family permease
MKSSPVYYGWIIWAVGTWGLIATSPGQSYSVSLFFDHFVADFDLSRTVVSSLYGAGTLVSAASLTFVGKAIDRYGNRRMGLLISAAFAVVLVAFSLVTGPVTLLVGFALIRGLGQGALTLNSSTSIAGWFQRKRGLALGLSTFVYLVAQGLYVLGVNALVKGVGWRGAWIVLGIGVTLTILPRTGRWHRPCGRRSTGSSSARLPCRARGLPRWSSTCNRYSAWWATRRRLLSRTLRSPPWSLPCLRSWPGRSSTGLGRGRSRQS